MTGLIVIGHAPARAMRSRAAMLALALMVMAAVSSARAESRPTITVGALTLAPCRAQYAGYCGSFERPLDPGGHMPGTLQIGFEWYPRRDIDRPALGTIAAQEGGPGYSTTGSRDGYVRMLDPLRDRRDILLMDKRGTGTSGALACPSLQGSASPSIADYAACGAHLGPSAWLYGSDFAADDLAALLDALGVARIDYYGDSYGTFFGEVFAARHPDRLRTLVLDSAYPARGLTPWWASEYETAPRALELSCARSPSCAALPGDPVLRLDRLVARVRARPLRGVAPGPNGRPRTVTVDPASLFLMLDFAGNSPITWRDFDAANRAYLDAGDALPLLRLTAEALGGAATGNGSPEAFSSGLAAAVQCSDYPQPFVFADDLAARHRRLQAAVTDQRERQPLAYAPFTIGEVLAAPYQPIPAATCLGWTAPPPGLGITPGQPDGALAFPDVPVLVINGELDTITSPLDGRNAAALFPASHLVLVANAIHETAIGDGGYFVPPFGGDIARCGSAVVRHFIASGGDPGDLACTRATRPIRTVPRFAALAAQVAPADALPGNQAGEPALRLASAAAETVGDVLARYYVTLSGSDSGLRGGTWSLQATARGYRFTLDAVRWTDDLAVSGSVAWDQYSGRVDASLTVGGVTSGTLRMAWEDRRTDAICRLEGNISGQSVLAARIAP